MVIFLVAKRFPFYLMVRYILVLLSYAYENNCSAIGDGNIFVIKICNKMYQNSIHLEEKR